MPHRLIVHMGFHLTGMAHASRLLQQNLGTLSDYVQIVFPRDIAGLTKATRTYALSRDPLDLGFLQYEAAHCAEDWTADSVLVTAEDLAGPLPGPRSTEDYSSLPAVAAALCETWDEALPGTDICLAFTQYDTIAWLDSAYDHFLRETRLTLSSARFREEFATAAQTPAILAQVQGATPDAHVSAIRVDQYQRSPLGPLGPLLDLAEVPQSIQEELKPIHQKRSRLSRKQREAFLLLNRSSLSDAEVAARKRHAV